ncbi:MAG: 6-pyruvoyl tetrahydropterin synthase family protein [Odoribacteraceae bacterium]|jgi:6-pyruvoyltetrahydropterin/6-carboxytetrahydropterin synthase|nr:6-pyruvoyl tetrahydropterin synthase family protein [Odoribacteraceae bacterium]
MRIRKLFRFEAAHVVRNCHARRCRENIHGHSYIVEVFISSETLDKGYMVMDFTLLDEVKALIDRFDHSYCLWQGEEEELKRFIYRYNQRVVEMPVSPSAEGFALLLFFLVDNILRHTVLSNGEGEVQLHSVRVHETATGYAEAFREDMKLVDFTHDDILFSGSILHEEATSTKHRDDVHG